MWRSPDGCAATTAAVPGSVAGRADDLDDLTLDYWRIVQRLRQTPLPPIDKDLLLAEIEEAYWRAALVSAWLDR